MARQLVHIEPDLVLAEEVRRAFEPAGFTVVNLPAGEGAVERCKAAHPDLILLAAELPDMSGFSVCNRIKRAFGSIPLILYAGEAAPAAIEAHRNTRTRADEYLTKPFDIADLVGRAAQLLEGAANRPPGAPPVPPTLRRTAPPGESPPPPRPGAAQPAGPTGPAMARQSAATAERPHAEAGPSHFFDPFADAPRDPAPPRGSPEEKLEFFRERLRARDTFLARVREAFATGRTEVERLAHEADTARAELLQESERRKALEDRLRELEAGATDKEQQLREAESTRQSLSDVLSETIQQREAAEQQWTQKLAVAEEERAKLEKEREQERAQTEEDTNRRIGEWQGERNELAARIHQTEAERDDLAATVKRLEAQHEHVTSSHAQWQEGAEREMAALRAELASARAHSEAQAAELAEAVALVDRLKADSGRTQERIDAFEAETKEAKAEAHAYAEKAMATEQAFLAQGAELETARRRNAELAAALDQGRASAEGVRGQVTKLQEELARQSRQLTQATAEREQLGKEMVAERQAREEAQTAAEKLLAEVTRLRELESQASDVPRLRRELALAQEVLQQRTQQLQSASRSAHDAGAERERVREKLELEIARLSNELARRDTEVTTQRRRQAEFEQRHTEREEQTRHMAAELEKVRHAQASEAVQVEKHHIEEVQRLKAALVELERRLEVGGRSEQQLRKRLTELEKRGTAAPGNAQELAALRERVKTLEEEIQDLRGENDFLNTEVARYHQKAKELMTRAAAKEET